MLQGSGFRFRGFRVQGLGFGVSGSGGMVQMLQGSWFRGKGFGFGV